VSVEELYREVILDHYHNPRHRGSLAAASAHAEGSNPLCGDEITLDLAVVDGTVADLAFNGQGCSISQASASMMSDAVIGKSIDEIHELTGRFKSMMTIEEGDAGLDPERPGSVLGDLEALQGVRKFPVRIKCADLAWTTLADALGTPDTV
jgi:nitrogen fixation NifU-like protein